MPKTTLSSRLREFAEKHVSVRNEMENNDFSPKSNDLFLLLAEWRLLDVGIAKRKLEDAILHKASESSLSDLARALLQSVPASVPETYIVLKMTSLLKNRCFFPDQDFPVTEEDLFALEPVSAEVGNQEMLALVNSLIDRSFSDFPEGRVRREEFKRRLLDFQRKKHRRSYVFALFNWLKTYDAWLDSKSSWPIRSFLMDAIRNRSTRPFFGEMLSMWRDSAHRPELASELLSAMIEEICLIPSSKPKEIPRWFSNLMKDIESLPFELRCSAAEKVQDLRMFLSYELGEPCSKEIAIGQVEFAAPLSPVRKKLPVKNTKSLLPKFAQIKNFATDFLSALWQEELSLFSVK